MKTQEDKAGKNLSQADDGRERAIQFGIYRFYDRDLFESTARNSAILKIHNKTHLS